MEADSGKYLDAYMPMDRRQAMVLGKDLPQKSDGTVMFADISGFTALTGKLARELGVQRGAEEIAKYLNIIYDGIISQIHEYMGSVISYAGDAVTCWFDQDDGRRAVAAGFAIKRTSAELAEKHKISVHIKVVIARGETQRYVVGDPEIQLMDLLVGETISKVILAEKMAKPGDILVSESIAEQYKQIFTSGKSFTSSGGEKYMLITSVKEHTPATPWWIDKHLENEEISEWLLSPVIKKIQHGEEKFLSELRLTVSMFLKFDGIDFDTDPESGIKINSFIQWVQKSLEYTDGHLLQVIIGDKGDYLFIGFGALTAHEDDASRAISSAELLCQPPKSLSFIRDIQIGITLGRMFTGPYGSSARRTYSMIGESANLAARLMERAEPGQILLTEKVAIAAQDQYIFEPLGTARFKGFDKAVPILTISGKQNTNRNIQLNQTPLVGRVEEMRKILDYTKNLGRSNNIGIVLLQGEGGTGKSRLLSEVLSRINDPGIRILHGFAYSIESSTPYFIIREILRQLINPEQFSQKELEDKLVSMLIDKGDGMERLLPLLSDVMSLELSDNELTAQMYGSVRASNLSRVLISLFKMIIQENSYLLILDDAHWIDAASWSFIKELKDAIPELGLIISSRPFADESSGDYLELIENSDKIGVHLNNFHRQELEKLVGQVIGANDLSEEVLSLIFDRTSGHPFFSEELAYALIESGTLVVEDGVCHLQDQNGSTDQTVPNTIQTAITSRLDRMTLPQQLSIKVASILGRLFVLNAVYGIHPTPPQLKSLRSQMDKMTELNLISKQLVDPEISYSFKQSIIHDVAYNMLSFSQRHELHQKAALWHEKSYSQNLEQYYAHLGYHWQQAEVYYKAVDYFEKAAFNAISKGAYRDAIVFIEQTLALAAKTKISTKRKAILFMEMGIAYFKIGELDEADGKLIKGIRLLKHPAPKTYLALGINLMVQSTRQFIYRVRDKRSKKPESLIVSETDRRNIRITLSRAYEYLAQSYFHHNKLFFSLDAGLSSLNVAESTEPSPQLARAYASICVTSSNMPIPGLYEEYARLAKSLLSKDVGLDDHGRILELIAVALSGKGRWMEIEQLCNEAIKMANEIGDRFLMMENTCILAAGLLPQGKIDESIKLRRELLEIGKQDKVELVQGWAYLQLAEISLMNKEYLEGHEFLLSADEFEEALGQPDKLWLHGLHAAIYSGLNEHEKAIDSAQKALSLARQSMPTSFFVLEGYAGMMTAFSSLDSLKMNNKSIDRSRKQAINAFSKFAGSFPIGRPRYNYWKARLELMKGKSSSAKNFQSKGLKIAKDLNMVYETERLNLLFA